MYDVAAGTVRQLDNDALSGELAFLPRYREVVYFNTRGALIMQEIESLQQWVIANSSAYPPDRPRNIASPYGNTLYYRAQQVESNIWIVRRTAANGGEEAVVRWLLDGGTLVTQISGDSVDPTPTL